MPMNARRDRWMANALLASSSFIPLLCVVFASQHTLMQPEGTFTLLWICLSCTSNVFENNW